MPTGIVLRPNPAAENLVDDAIAQAKRIRDSGVRQIWLAQQFDTDAIALAGLIGAAVPRLGVGTSVVPINPRHPLLVAGQAQTAQAASHGNFSLGLGSHDPERQAFGTPVPVYVAAMGPKALRVTGELADGTLPFDVDAGRAAAAQQLGFYETIPSYQKVIAREGVEHVADLAAIGPADAVRRELTRYLDAGATDVVLSPLGTEPADAERLWEAASI